MTRTFATLLLLLPATVLAAETDLLPKGVWVLDVSYVSSTLDGQWSNEGVHQSLLEDIVRYEPGGGLQGVITARPDVTFDVLVTNLMYGLTDDLSLVLNIPLVTQTRVVTNIGWDQGDYQPQLGRSYSEDDFWAWAESMGQPRPPGEWRGNQYALADMVIGGRYRLPTFEWMKQAKLSAVFGFQFALPTGRDADPEEIVAVGTTAWDLHTYGDAELHLAVSRPLWIDQTGLQRLGVTVDGFYAWLRPRTLESPRGEKNPLLLNYAPYIGDTYEVDGGDWFAGSLTFDIAAWAGPTARGLIYKEAPPPTAGLPPLLALSLAYSHIRTLQSDWTSESPLWDWDREKFWRPGYKNRLGVGAVVSLVRVGVPLQLYASYRTQTLIPGKNVRPSNTLTGGVRMLAQF